MNKDSVAENAVRFFRNIHGGSEGFVHVQTIDLASHVTDHKFFKWPTGADEIGSYIERSTLEGKEVYTSPVLFLDNTSYEKDNIAFSKVVWAEFDGNARRQNKNVPEPTLRILSGRPNGEHWYWVLENELRDVQELESINRSLSRELDADPTCWEASRVLRIPGTVNHKYEVPRRVEIFKTSRRSFDISDFDKISNSNAGSEIAIVERSEIVTRTTLVKTKTWDDDDIWDLYFAKDIDPYLANGKMLEFANWAASRETNKWSDGEIFSALVHMNDQHKVFNGHSNPNFEIAKIVARAREKNPVAFFEEGVMDSFSSDEDIRGYTLRELAALEIVVKWIVEGILMEQSNLVIAAPGGTGKSQLMFRFGQAIASGTDFLGWKIKSGPQRVVYLALEFGMAQAKTMLTDMNLNLETLSENYDGNFVMIPRGFGVKLNTQVGREDFMKIMLRYRPDVMIIDSIKGLVEGQITQDGPVGEVFEYLGMIQKHFGTVFMIIHHTRKGNFQSPVPTSGDDFMGSAYITNNASTTMLLTKLNKDDPDSPLKLVFPKTRNMRDGEVVYLRRTEDLNFLQISEEEALGKVKKQASREPEIMNKSEMDLILAAIQSSASAINSKKEEE